MSLYINDNIDNYLLEGLAFNQEAAEWLNSTPKDTFYNPITSSDSLTNNLDNPFDNDGYLECSSPLGEQFIRSQIEENKQQQLEEQVNVDYGPEARLIVDFKQRINPFLTIHIEESTINRVYSSCPTITETFLFFAICTSASMIGGGNIKDAKSVDYYEKAIDLMGCIPKIHRDEPFFAAMFIMRDLGVYLSSRLS